MKTASLTAADPLPGWWGWVLFATTAVLLSACQSNTLRPQDGSGGFANLNQAAAPQFVPPGAPAPGMQTPGMQVAPMAAMPVPNQPGRLMNPATGEILPVAHQEFDQQNEVAPGMLSDQFEGDSMSIPCIQCTDGYMYGPSPYPIHSCGPVCGAGCPPAAAATCMPCGGCMPCATCPDGSAFKPYDEYLCDGGDNRSPVKINAQWELAGLDDEDTIAHYDTLDGETRIQPSNKVCIYAPRFAAVRVVAGLNLNEQVLALSDAKQKQQLARTLENIPPISRVQNLQPWRELGTDKASGIRGNDIPAAMSNTVAAFDYTMALLPYENTSLIRYGVLSQGDKPMLAQSSLAAITWTHNLGVQVVIDGVRAAEVVKDVKAQETIETHAVGPSRLRICKLASTDAAQPGDIVSFTLRFDNTGNHPIGNVVIVDNLTTRLEYVPDSAQASCKLDYERDEKGQIKRDAKNNPIWKQNPITFSNKANEGDSLTLRWELLEPLQPGQGGIIRFQCRVR